MKRIKFNLTPSELTKLRAICKVTKLGFNSMAARPKVARELIDKYKEFWGKGINAYADSGMD